MQGTLNEIDLRSILQLIELGQRTGQLLVEARKPVVTDDSTWRSPQQNTAPLSAWLVFS
ncbi:DUF4388 domain-containing protein [Picosynechococcus sp. NKBG15041c]|uniref:DUF4388 domain-containing protein n=1 Tax=Picosynechococcus sp. NKBG15041c TaxID=1407650 RepID=UPI0004195F45|nr:DUF4388 domain-containing protein [Picosynechococcus sp. NKBG15041c]